jgi:hypothetical protein
VLPLDRYSEVALFLAQVMSRRRTVKVHSLHFCHGTNQPLGERQGTLHCLGELFLSNRDVMSGCGLLYTSFIV